MSHPCILLVEDSTTQALQITHVLEQQGWRVIWKSTAEEAIEEIREGTPDLVLLDFYLPGVRGDELCRRIRMHVDSRELPVIMLTSETTTAIELRGLESGADGFLHKSADPDILIARVKGFLSKAPAARNQIVGAGSAPSLSQARILAVDDDPVFLAYLSAELASEGYAFEQASSGREAVQRLQTEPFDCVLIDLMMPDIDGLAVCREVEKIRRSREASLAALVLTAHTSKEDLQRSLEAGADDFVGKSSEMSVLKWRIRALLRRKFFQQENHRIQTELREKELETLRARAAQEIAEARAALVGELQRTAAELRASQAELSAAKEAAEAANRAKDHFLAVLSHELRTPLTPVLALLSQRRNDAEISAELREDFEMIHRNVELEARLIDDLLDLTRITRGKLELRREKVDAQPLLQHALQVCTPLARDHHRVVQMQIEATHTIVHGDPARLIQVWWNLLRNAWKFTPDDGTITIRARNEANPADPTAPFLIIEISDDGIGIAPEVLPRIFNAFEQGGRGITHQFGGLGLGLAISKAIVELHGGVLSAHSEGLGHGATFRVQLPTAPVSVAQGSPTTPLGHAPAAPASVSRGGLHRPLRILLVEDHHDTATIIQRLLRRRGHEVSHADSLRAARDVMGGDCVFDLLISDLGLPDGSGLDLMREASADPKVLGIALSGYGMDDDLDRSREAGFQLHLTKPVQLEELEAAIQTLFST